ncbi:hypothetical protein DTO063F5_1094 [Paecilomyces variotii]|nr:hypothetical protein DTO063F5_1094 [Paecilomyces variotii]
MSAQIGLSGEPPESWPDLARRAKEKINQYECIPFLDDEKLVPCMIALLDYLPEGGRESTARDILSCEGNKKKLYDVFQNICSCLLFAMKAAGHSSINRTPIDDYRNDNVEPIISELNDPQHRERQFRDKVLYRDRFRCVVTKDMDFNHWEKVGEPAGIMYSELEAAHIIPLPLASWKESPTASFDASNIWETLYRCFPKVRQIGMKVDNINNPCNGISLRDSLHTQFRKFHLAFAPTAIPNTYKVKTYLAFPTYLRRDIPYDGFICFTDSSKAHDVPLPDAALLDCHYRIAEVLNASGMLGEIDTKIEEWEDMKVNIWDGHLAEDGITDVSAYSP